MRISIKSAMVAFVCFLQLENVQGQFIKEYFKAPDQPTSWHAIVPVNDTYTSNLYAAGTYGSQILIGEIRQNGALVWTRKIMINESGYIINSMIRDSDGNLVLCGSKYVGPGDDGFGFLLKFNPITKALVWMQKADQNVLFFDVAEWGDGGDYVIGGQDEYLGTGTGADDLTLVANRTTGALTTLVNLNGHINDNVDALAVHPDSQYVYTTGRYELDPGGADKFRIVLNKIDQLGNIVWSKYYIKSTASTARFYPKDIFIDGASIYIAACGDDVGTNSVKNLYLLKLNLNGDLDWVKKFDITTNSNDGVLCAIKKWGSGLIISGSMYTGTYTDLFLLGVGFDGSLNFGNSYPFRKVTNAYGLQMTSAMTIISQNVFLVGERLELDGTMRGVMLQASVSSGDAGTCDSPISITASTYVSPYQGEAIFDTVSCALLFNQPAPTIKKQNISTYLDCVAPRYGVTEEFDELVESELTILSCYPNPAIDLVFVEWRLEITDAINYKIYDTQGNLVKSYTSDTRNSQLDLSALPNGIYTIYGRSADEIATTRIIKQF